jgi:hypothetical protein
MRAGRPRYDFSLKQVLINYFINIRKKEEGETKIEGEFGLPVILNGVHNRERDCGLRSE